LLLGLIYPLVGIGLVVGARFILFGASRHRRAEENCGMSNFAQIFAHQSASRSPMANAIEAAYSIINAYAVPSIIVLAATAMLVLGRR
jgi:hypothetical protein